MALPGYDPVMTPQVEDSRRRRNGPEETWEEIASRIKKDLGPWLPGSKWWGEQAPKSITDEFIKLYHDALSIKIKIPESDLLEWQKKIWRNDLQKCSENWTPEYLPTSTDKEIEVTFSPRFNSFSVSAISRGGTFPKIVFCNTHLYGGYHYIAIPCNLKKLAIEYPEIAINSASILEQLANIVKSYAKEKNINYRGQDEIHHKAMKSILFAWWAKRGGSINNFPTLLKKLKFPLRIIKDDGNYEELNLSEETAKQARERLNPQFYNYLKILHSQRDDFSKLKEFLLAGV